VSDLARIHYVIPDDLHRQVKAAAALRGRTLKQFVVEALEAAVAELEAEQEAEDDR
jgi:uncharacterized protein (DUF1778 family)